MYDHEFYAKVDGLVMAVWKDFGRKVLGVLGITVYYAILMPIRLYEYIRDCMETERKSQREEANRFRALKENGHI